ncbi:hypothetical protein [Blastococcus sp. CT_GayMR16]|uniref:hypothetical protein n=1 Tax=Blastococcus sp. CT_GayMR16 TaxID=2559607 RepID=UPI001073D043|nr:hypothetical protein [Blastococcus sp. CT_GayMR16]TFV91399.1 hypothetical protein E4P38_02085 [Blastococcus sp. CT_GayMR16]
MAKPVVRDPAEERQAEGIAFGLYVLQAPIGADHQQKWRELQGTRRQEFDLLMSKARFVLAMAPDVPTRDPV